jgi:methylated-DNA-[protein]-cysteine S-methyltransferase
MAESFSVFETPLGWAGLAWTERGVAGVELPGSDAARVRARLRRRFPQADASPAPAEIRDAMQGIVAVLGGQARDLSRVQLDERGVSAFEHAVYAVARRIPFGQTRTYGQVAAEVGDPRLARDVGQALARNPFPIVVPCHRIIAAGGKLGGFSARGGVTTKQRLLAIERANVSWQLPLEAAAI